MPHRKLRCGPDILDGDGDFLTRRRVKSSHVVTHFVVGLNCYFFRRCLRSMRATGKEPEKCAATKGNRSDYLNNCFSHALKLERREKSRLDADQAFCRFFLERKPPSISILPMHKLLLAACVALALLACGRSTNSDERDDHHDTRGVVRGFSPDRSTIEIQHENIPDFMPSMTMPFVARGAKQIADLRTGDAISFRMTVTQKDFWIDNVKKIRCEEVNVSEPKLAPAVSSENGRRLKEGDAMPLFSLTNQNGERISLNTLRGQPFVLTFVFTRCPLPNFCPLMSNNFEELQTAIKGSSGALANTRLLSITLDPGFDTPEVLKTYAGY